MIEIIKSPNKFDKKKHENSLKIFVGGSIEMGNCVDWQKDLTENISKNLNIDIVFFNPRRDVWDNSWVQRMSNPTFNEQVNWELDHLEISDLILIHFEPGTKSPISLFEAGLFASSNKMIISCPDGYYRKGNLEIVCHRKKIPFFDSLSEAEEYIYRKYK